MTTQIDLHGAEVIELASQDTPITVGETSVVGLVGGAPNAEAGAAASLVVGDGASSIRVTADNVGKAGNDLSVEVVNPGASGTLAITYDAPTERITITLATDGSSVIQSTAAAVAGTDQAALNDIATVTLATGSGTGTMAAADAANLTGGRDDPFPTNVPVLVNTSAQARRLGGTGALVDAINDVWRTSGRLGALIVAVKTADDTETNIIGARASRTGIYALLGAASRVGYKPTLIGTIAQKSAGVTAALTAVADDLRAIPVAALEGANASEAQTAADGLARVYAVWPDLVVSDAGVETVKNPSGLVLGHIVRTDREKNVAESPSNRRLSDVLRTAVDVDWELDSRTATANILSRAFITTAVRRRDGLYLWGNRLASGELITHRRVRYVVREALLGYIVDYIDRNVDVPFVEFVLTRMNKFLRDRSLSGSRRMLTGGRAWFDPAENTDETLGANQVSFSYDLGLFNVAEHLRFVETVTGVYNERIIAELAGG